MIEAQPTGMSHQPSPYPTQPVPVPDAAQTGGAQRSPAGPKQGDRYGALGSTQGFRPGLRGHSFNRLDDMFAAIRSGQIEATPGLMYSVNGQPFTIVNVPGEGGGLAAVRSLRVGDVMVPEPRMHDPQTWGSYLTDRQRNAMLGHFRQNYGALPKDLQDRLHRLGISKSTAIEGHSRRDRESIMGSLQREENELLHLVLTTTGLGSEASAAAGESSRSLSEYEAVLRQQAEEEALNKEFAEMEKQRRSIELKRIQAELDIQKQQIAHELRIQEDLAKRQAAEQHRRDRYSADNPPIPYDTYEQGGVDRGRPGVPSPFAQAAAGVDGEESTPLQTTRTGGVDARAIQVRWAAMDESSRELVRDLLDSIGSMPMSPMARAGLTADQQQIINTRATRFNARELMDILRIADGSIPMHPGDDLLQRRSDVERQLRSMVEEIQGAGRAPTDEERSRLQALLGEQQSVDRSIGSSQNQQRMTALLNMMERKTPGFIMHHYRLDPATTPNQIAERKREFASQLASFAGLIDDPDPSTANSAIHGTVNSLLALYAMGHRGGGADNAMMDEMHKAFMSGGINEAVAYYRQLRTRTAASGTPATLPPREGAGVVMEEPSGARQPRGSR